MLTLHPYPYLQSYLTKLQLDIMSVRSLIPDSLSKLEWLIFTLFFLSRSSFQQLAQSKVPE